MQVRPGKRCDTIRQQHTVDNTQDQPEDCQESPHNNPPAHQIHYQRGSKDQKGIVQKHQGPLRHIGICLADGMPGDCFYNKVPHHDHYHLNRQRKQIQIF